MNEIDDIIIRGPLNEEEFEHMYDLRWRLLRKPWNQLKGSEKDDLDEIEGKSYHFIAIIDSEIVGTARYQVNDNKEGQIRYLAVEEAFQRKGIATKLIRECESLAYKQRIPAIILNGRKTALRLFKKLEYKILREGHTLYGEIEHYVFWKMLYYPS